jgi:hypothetical protein
MTFRLNAFQARNRNAPLERGETVTDETRQSGMRSAGAVRALFCIPDAATQEVCPMHHNTPRGEAVRRALLAIVQARAVADLPLPTHRAMAAALGISPGQVTRHLAVLMDGGAFTPVNHGTHIRVEELRP